MFGPWEARCVVLAFRDRLQFICHHLRSLLAIAGLCLLAGCARFQPQPLSPDQTAARLESRSLDSPALKSFLERNLHRDLTNWPAGGWDFETLTLAAFYYHPSLEVARADWRVAASGIETAEERPNPTATWSATYEPVPDAFSPWIPGLVIDLPIETAGKRRFRTDQARHLSESARFNVATAAWQVRSQLRASLLDFVAARQRVDLLQHQAGLRQDLVSRLQRQFQAGAVSAIELNVTRRALIRAQTEVSDAQRVLAEAGPRLAGAMGLPVTALEGRDVRFDLTPSPNVEKLTAKEVRGLALRGRADILSALADYAASQSALQLAVAKQYPDVHLAPGYFWNAGSAGENDWQIGATVELPLLNQHKGAITEASARREASAARFLALQAKVITDIDTAVASVHAGQTNLATIEELAGVQAAQHKAVAAQLEAGAADRLELLAAELEVSAAGLVCLDARVKLQQAVGALEDAVQRPLDLPQAIFESKPGDNH
jgi:outer membrane protein, heavy metal efflux system